MDVPEEKVDTLPPEEVMGGYDLPEEKSKMPSGWKALLTPALIAVIVCFVMFQFFFAPGLVSKEDATTNFTNITNTITEIQKSQETLKNSLTTKADASQVANLSQQIAAMQNSLNNLPSTASIDNMTATITSNVTAAFNEKMSTVNTAITDIKADIKELQTVKEEETTTTTVKDDLDVSFGYSNNFTFLKDTATTEATLYFQVENNSNYDVENVEIELVIHSRGVPISLASGNCSVTGGWPLQWQKVYVGSGTYVLTGITPTYGGGLTVDSDDEANVYVTVILGASPVPTTDVTFYVEASVTDYDIIK